MILGNVGGRKDSSQRAWRDKSHQGILTIIFRLVLTLRQLILREAHLWSKLHHEHILPFLGITTDFDLIVSIVTPWMEKGNAYDYVQDRAIDPRPLVCRSALI